MYRAGGLLPLSATRSLRTGERVSPEVRGHEKRVSTGVNALTSAAWHAASFWRARLYTAIAFVGATASRTVSAGFQEELTSLRETTPTATDKLAVDLDEAAQLVSCSVKTLKRMVAAGKLPGASS